MAARNEMRAHRAASRLLLPLAAGLVLLAGCQSASHQRGLQPSAEPTGLQRALMVEAAQADALRRLAGLLVGVHLESESKVSNYTLEKYEIRVLNGAQISEVVSEGRLLAGVRFGEPRFTHDGAFCVVPAFLSTAQLHRNLDLIRESGQNLNPYQAIDVSPYEPYHGLMVNGYAVLPGPILESRGDIVGVLEKLKGPPLAKLRACRAAELDALVQLAARAHGCVLRSSQMVSELATEESRLEAEIRGLMQGAVIESYEAVGDNLVMVTVRVKGALVAQLTGDESPPVDEQSWLRATGFGGVSLRGSEGLSDSEEGCVVDETRPRVFEGVTRRHEE